MRPVQANSGNRGGFSLIELLITITIMSIVISLIVAFLGVTGSAAREAATRATLVKLDALVQARFRQMTESFADQERKKVRADLTVPATTLNTRARWVSLLPQWLNLQSNAESLGGTNPLPAKLAYIKVDRYRGSFPQRTADLYGFSYTDDGSSYTDDSPYTSLWPTTLPSSHQAATESSELLYMILAKGGGTGSEAQIADSINPRHIKDTDGDGLMEFVDDWGNPLRFYLSPTRLIRPGGAYTVPTSAQYSLAKSLISTLPPLPSSATDFTAIFNQDPLDPRGALRATNPFPASPGASDRWYYGSVAGATFEERYHTPDTWFVPLIVSCGADEALGLEEPTAATANRHAGVIIADDVGDNLTNLQSVGGQK